MMKRLLLLITMLLISALIGTSCTELAGMAVEKMIQREDVEGLIDVLEDEGVDADIRGRAAWGLGHIGDTRGVEPLIQALGDEESVVRWIAAEALGKIADATAVEPLIQALRDEESIVRSKSAEALGEIEDTRAVEPLTEALEDEDDDVRQAAREALGKIRSS